MNFNTVAGFIGGTGRNQLLPQTLATVTETEINVGVDANSTGVIAVLQVPQQTTIAGSGNPLNFDINAALLQENGGNVAGLPARGRPGFSTATFDSGRPFLVRVAGVITPASQAANSLNIILYSGTTKGGTAIATT